MAKPLVYNFPIMHVPRIFCMHSLLALFVNKYWFAPCLLEVVPQFRLMSFLVESVYRNLSKIFFSILMAYILLYLFSVVSFVFMKNQYDLGGHQDCNDLPSCFKLHIDFGLSNSPNWHSE